MASNNDPLCALPVISLLHPALERDGGSSPGMKWSRLLARSIPGLTLSPPPVLSVHASLREFYKLSQSFKTLKSQLGTGTTERESKDCMGDGRAKSP